MSLELFGSQVGIIAVLIGFLVIVYLFSKQLNLSATGDVFNFILLGFGILVLLVIMGFRGGAGLRV